MMKRIDNSLLLSSILSTYSSAGEKGISINQCSEGLYLSDDDLQDGDVRFGVKIGKEEIGELKPVPINYPVHKNMLISCLNYGFVEIQDWMGSDEEIVAAARTSYASGKAATADRTLLRYLMRHLHSTPFEAATALKFRLYIPIVVYRQLFRHRTASQLEPQFISNDTAFGTYSVQNEMSGRYVELPDHFYIPEARRIQLQSKTNKQGSEKEGMQSEDQLNALHQMNNSINACRHAYQQLLELGVARETARNVLPLTQYTLLVWKIDLKNLLHFLMLRLDPHAQWEVREYAKAMSELVKRLFPMTWEAFEDFQMFVTKFNPVEMRTIMESFDGSGIEGAIHRFEDRVSNERERAEFAAKLRKYF